MDEWNELIQNLNPQPPKTYYSEDVLCEVDDPYGFLKDMMTIEFLNRWMHMCYIDLGPFSLIWVAN